MWASGHTDGPWAVCVRECAYVCVCVCVCVLVCVGGCKNAEGSDNIFYGNLRD